MRRGCKWSIAAGFGTWNIGVLNRGEDEAQWGSIGAVLAPRAQENPLVVSTVAWPG